MKDKEIIKKLKREWVSWCKRNDYNKNGFVGILIVWDYCERALKLKSEDKQ